MRKPRRQETQCCMPELVRRSGRPGPSHNPNARHVIRTPKCNRTPRHRSPVPQAHTPMTGIGDSTVRPVARDIRDTEQFETANDEPENPGDWTPAKRVRLKSETSCAGEKAERDAYRSRTHGKRPAAENGQTVSSANKRKSDQP